MRLSPWPQSLFGRLLAASVAAVLLAHTAGLFLIAQERGGFVLQGGVREGARRIAEPTPVLQPPPPADRAPAAAPPPPTPHPLPQPHHAPGPPRPPGGPG